ncbi:tyrosine-type recombinase/integrase [Oceanobacillus kimchii]|uniref:tyrosine-type recombinase/integrase n=1 Tax=Oceanobacillus kimchii TaxID=746691 RepID=UPI003B028D5E
MDKNLDELFRIFLSIKKAEGKADSTIAQYKQNYRYFTDYLDKCDIERNFAELNKTIFRNYISFMREDMVKFANHAYKTDRERTVGLSPSTINTRMKTLRTIFRCLYEEEITDSNPIQGVKNIPNPLENIDILTSDELTKLLKVPNRKSFAGYRDLTLTHLLLDGMMRISEAINLKINNFDLKNNSVTIPASIAKSRKTRTLPLQPVTVRMIKRLIEINEDFNSGYVFLTNYGERISRDHYRKRLNDYAKQAKITKNIHPHLLRHTAATLFLEDGGDIRHLQLLLGHADLRMVLRYTHPSKKSLEEQSTKHSVINRVSDKLSRPRKTKI